MMREGPFVAVVGGVNIDICGKPFGPLVSHDSNPGTVRVSLGGVGRNIAHNMALLGLDVSLLTAIGRDENARLVEDSCRDLGIDLADSLRLEDGATSTYLVLTDHKGEMELAVSDMAIYDRLTPDYIAARLDVLNQAQLVVADTNIPAETLAYLAHYCTAPIFADPVSTAKAVKLKPILGKLYTLKANRLEAALLSGVDITDDASLERSAKALLDTGLERVFISLGPDGVLAARGGETVRLPTVPGPMKNATGCGDAFMAALAWGYREGLDLTQTARAGLAAAAIALAGEETINPAMSVAKLRELANL